MSEQAVETRAKYVTHDDVVAMRAGRTTSQLHETTICRAKCAQCRQVIRERRRLAFVVPGLAWVSFAHIDEATCNQNISATKLKASGRKTGGLKVKQQPVYQPKKTGWTLTKDEAAQVLAEPLGFIPDNRLDRRSVQCRLCSKVISPETARCFFKLHDLETHWTIRTGYVHRSCVEKAEVA